MATSVSGVPRELVKSFFNFRALPVNVPKTSLDELNKVERHLNQGSQLSYWLGMSLISRKTRNSMASQKDSFGQAEEHNDDRYLLWTCVSYQRYQ